MKPLVSSARKPVAGFSPVGPYDGAKVIEVTLILKRRQSIESSKLVALYSAPPGERRYLSREEFAESHGAEPGAMARIAEFALGHKLSVVEENQGARTVKLSGTVAAFQKIFHVDLKIYQDAGGECSYRGRTGEIFVPNEIASVVESVHGLDDRQQARPHFRLRSAQGDLAAKQTFSPAEVATAYEFPANLTGKGQTIAIIELGGGYNTQDLLSYFGQFKANPKVTAVSVDGGANQPTGDPSGPDGEVMLDVEVAGAIATNARIVVYFAPNTDQGFLDAITTAVHDQTNKPSIVSISWGGPESSWTVQSLESFNQVFQDAAMLGVTVLAASGDQGSTDGVNDGGSHVDFPSSSPFVLACGGTQLTVAGSGTITSEVAWGGTAADGATGGGVSSHFSVPAYQTGKILKQFKGRGVPDAAGNADPQTGYVVLVDGSQAVIGGTSAVAPLYAALVARLNEALPAPAGFLNPILYNNPDVFRDVIKGTNGAFNAAPGWDPATGLGSVKGTALLSRLQSP